MGMPKRFVCSGAVALGLLGACISGEVRAQEIPCTEEIRTFCAGVQPGGGRILQCLKAQSTDNIQVVLNTGGTVGGFIYDKDGNPEEGVTIYAANSHTYHSLTAGNIGLLGTAISDPNGFYQIKALPEQTCYLMRQNEWEALGVVRRTILPLSGKICQVDFGGKVCLTGQIILDGKPLISQQILLASEGNPHSGNFKAYTSTDAHGKFIFRGLIPSRLAVYYQQETQRSDWLSSSRQASMRARSASSR